MPAVVTALMQRLRADAELQAFATATHQSKEAGCETWFATQTVGSLKTGWAVQYHVQYVQPPGTTDSTRVIDMCLTTCNAVGYPCPNGGR